MEEAMRKWLALWLMSLITVAGIASRLTRAQTPQVPPPFPSQAQPSVARVLSGPDIGFRVDSISRTGEPAGTLVIRVNGEWVPVMFSSGGMPRPAL